MRRVPVLTVVSLAAVLGLMVVPVHAATLFATDTPDIKLKPGDKADSAFDLGDFFDSATGATISYTATGGSVSGSVASVFGSATPGKLTATFTGTAGSEKATATSLVQVSTFLLKNGPAIDDNNRIAGQAPGNIFFNAIVPGQKVESAKALVGVLADGKSVSPGSVSGAAALFASVGEVTLGTFDTGLRSRTSAVLGSSATGKIAANGVTATMNANGTYSIATVKTTFTAPYVVTLGVKSGAGADGVHLVVAPAADVDIAKVGTMQMGTGTATAAGNKITADKGEALMVYATDTFTVGEYATISLDYTTDSTAANIAVIGFDGTLAFPNASYSNPGSTNLEKGVAKNLSITLKSNTGKVIPGFQVYCADGTANVTVTRLSVVNARPLVDYALNVNSEVDLPIDETMGDLTGWGSDVLGQGAKKPAADTDNNFAAPKAGSMLLSGKGGLSNAFVTIGLEKGTAVGECYVKRTGEPDNAESAFVLIATDGGANAFASFVGGSTIPTDKWIKVTCAGTLSVKAPAPSVLFVVQAAGVNVKVDDVALRIITDKDSFFDATLLGL